MSGSAVTELVALHLRFHTYSMGWTDSAVRRYVRDAGPLLRELNVLTRCDCTTRNERKAAQLSKRMDELEVRIDETGAREIAQPQGTSSGRPNIGGFNRHLGVQLGQRARRPTTASPDHCAPSRPTATP